MASLTVDDDLIFHMDDLSDEKERNKEIKKQTDFLKKGKMYRDLKRAADEKKYGRLVDDVGRDMRDALQRQNSDEFTRWLKGAKEHNKKIESKTSSPPKLESLSNPTQSNPFDPNPFIIQQTRPRSDSSDSDDDLLSGKFSSKTLNPREARMLLLQKQDMTKPAVLKKKSGGRKTRKKSKRFRNNLRKNKISRKYIMLKQCGGGKAKMGSKSKPYSSKRKAMKSRRRVCYYKKKGRTLKMKKKNKKSRKKSRRRR